MPASIAARSIGGRAAIAKRQIASRYGLTNAEEPHAYPAGSYTFTPPRAGYWKIVLWGGGAQGSSSFGGASGAYVEKTVLLSPATPVALVIGGSGSDSTAALPNGIITAGGASGNVPGAASGGDVNLDGALGGTTSTGSGADGSGSGGGPGGTATAGRAGAGAPANLPYHGGRGGIGASASPLPSSSLGITPGGGGGYSALVNEGAYGGEGFGVVSFVHD
jgi:hypothetical protein